MRGRKSKDFGGERVEREDARKGERGGEKKKKSMSKGGTRNVSSKKIFHNSLDQLATMMELPNFHGIKRFYSMP